MPSIKASCPEGLNPTIASAMNRRNFLKVCAGALSSASVLGVQAASDPKNLRTAPKSVQDAKRAALAHLRELGPTITDFEIRRKKNIPGKRAAF